MPAAALTSKSKRNASRPVIIDPTYAPLEKRPLPAGRPREWYITHNRRLKAMRLAIALLDSGVYLANQASNTRIRSMAEDVGIHPPSDITCHMVRALMRYSR
ncbi:hypothetical protein AB0Q95_01645 [Streptomyces sp. NPDC059900]|uniref:Uncharacterized protein n=1 Tax=Streptomyces longisporoflavus TaxID=28044 RepID=A0ABW7QKY9_9ACTN|nr:hypothetical protein [Streptomyces longisporoflavus]GGV38928.1 hypothetical protein GCM10010277_26370 [Streptomyces longisporoflavus]